MEAAQRDRERFTAPYEHLDILEAVMIIVDNALKAREAEGKPIRIGMVGSGFMAQGLTNQTMHSVPGMRMSAIYGRKLERALHCYKYAGCNDIVVASTQSEFDEAVSKGHRRSLRMRT